MIYIGSSNNLYQRMHGHLRELKGGKHKNKGLQELFNEHGDCYFTFFVMSKATGHEYRLTEKLCIDMYKKKGLALNGTVPPIRPVIIHGIRYPSVPVACAALGLTYTGINHRATSPTVRFADCYFEGETKESFDHDFRKVDLIVEDNGEKMTLAEFTRRKNIPYKTAHNRYKKGVPLDQLHLDLVRKVKTYHHDGKDLTLKEWAPLLGISYSTLIKRMIDDKMPFEDAILGSSREVRRMRGEPLYQKRTNA